MIHTIFRFSNGKNRNIRDKKITLEELFLTPNVCHSKKMIIFARK